MKSELTCLQVNRPILPDSVDRVMEFAHTVADKLGLEADEFRPVIFDGEPVINVFSAIGSLAKEIAETDGERIIAAAEESTEDMGTLDITDTIIPWGWDLQVPTGNRFNMLIKKPAIELKDRYGRLPFKERPISIMHSPAWRAIEEAVAYAKYGNRISKPTSRMLKRKSFRAVPLLAIEGDAQERVTSSSLIEVRDELVELIPKIEVGAVRLDIFVDGQEIPVDFGRVR